MTSIVYRAGDLEAQLLGSTGDALGAELVDEESLVIRPGEVVLSQFGGLRTPEWNELIAKAVHCASLVDRQLANGEHPPV